MIIRRGNLICHWFVMTALQYVTIIVIFIRFRLLPQQNILYSLVDWLNLFFLILYTTALAIKMCNLLCCRVVSANLPSGPNAVSTNLFDLSRSTSRGKRATPICDIIINVCRWKIGSAALSQRCWLATVTCILLYTINKKLIWTFSWIYFYFFHNTQYLVIQKA